MLSELRTEYIILRQTPPQALLKDCPYPNPVLKTNEDLAIAYMERGYALKECTEDKKALREWAD